jgi:hypothetical protein
MPTLVLYSCGGCKKRIGAHDAYYSIGEPFIICPNCKTANLITKHRNEWDLKTPLQRADEYGKVAFVSIALGSSLGLLAAYALRAVAITHGYWSAYFLVPFGAALVFWGLFSQLRRLIAESRKRLKNENYLAYLEKLGS